MKPKYDVLSSPQALIEVTIPKIKETWEHIKSWNKKKHNISPSLSFFSPSFFIMFFILCYHCKEFSFRCSLHIIGFLILHACVKLTKNPISETLHYQFLYKCVLAIILFYFSPSLPFGQFKLLITILIPLYYHILTSSLTISIITLLPIVITFLLLFPTGTPDSQSLLIPFIIIPTIIWIRAQNPNPKPLIDVNAKKTQNLPNQSVEEKRPLEKLFSAESLPDVKTLQKKISDPPIEDSERVILGISHDCRNLLSSLKAILTLLKDDDNGEDTPVQQDDNLQSAIAITEHLALLLTNLLNYLKRNEDNNNPEEMRLTSTLEKIWLMISPNLKKKGLDGTVAIKKRTPLNVELDERKFMGILLNLIGNAIKFTDKGNIKIDVYWKEEIQNSFGSRGSTDIMLPKSSEIDRESSGVNPVPYKSTFFDTKDVDSISFSKKCFTGVQQDNDDDFEHTMGWLVVNVKDTGCGIDEKSLKKLFTKYMQVGADPEKSKLGLGLGLWYTKYLLGKLKGKIDFQSKKDVGTWVQVEIPCKVMKTKPQSESIFNSQSFDGMRLHSGNQKLHVYIRNDDLLEGFFLRQSLKRKLNEELEITEIRSLSEIIDFNELQAKSTVLILEENSIQKENELTLEKLKNLHRRHKITIILLRESEESTLWENNETDFFIKKPMGHLQAGQLIRNIETATGRILSKSPKSSLKDEKAQVLLVDDENLSLMLLQGFFKKNGIKCDVAKDGCEALKIYKEKGEHIRVILMDSQMPRMNGLEASKAIRELEKERRVKIYGLTGDDSEEFVRQAKACGMNGVFVKPAPLRDLLQEVSSALKIQDDFTSVVVSL